MGVFISVSCVKKDHYIPMLIEHCIDSPHFEALESKIVWRGEFKRDFDEAYAAAQKELESRLPLPTLKEFYEVVKSYAKEAALPYALEILIKRYESNTKDEEPEEDKTVADYKIEWNYKEGKHIIYEYDLSPDSGWGAWEPLMKFEVFADAERWLIRTKDVCGYRRIINKAYYKINKTLD